MGCQGSEAKDWTGCGRGQFVVEGLRGSTYRLTTALPLGLSLLCSNIGTVVVLSMIPVRTRTHGRVGDVSGSMAVQVGVVGVEVVMVLVLRRIRLIDGHLVGHAFPRPGLRDDAAVRQTPQRLKTENLLRERGGTSRRRRAQIVKSGASVRPLGFCLAGVAGARGQRYGAGWGSTGGSCGRQR